MMGLTLRVVLSVTADVTSPTQCHGFTQFPASVSSCQNDRQRAGQGAARLAPTSGQKRSECPLTSPSSNLHLLHPPPTSSLRQNPNSSSFLQPPPVSSRHQPLSSTMLQPPPPPSSNLLLRTPTSAILQLPFISSSSNLLPSPTSNNFQQPSPPSFHPPTSDPLNLLTSSSP